MSAFAALKSFLKVICCDTKMTHTYRAESYKSEMWLNLNDGAFPALLDSAMKQALLASKASATCGYQVCIK